MNRNIPVLVSNLVAAITADRRLTTKQKRRKVLEAYEILGSPSAALTSASPTSRVVESRPPRVLTTASFLNFVRPALA